MKNDPKNILIEKTTEISQRDIKLSKKLLALHGEICDCQQYGYTQIQIRAFMEEAGLMVNKSTLSAFLSRVNKSKSRQKSIASPKRTHVVDQQSNKKEGFSMSTGDMLKFI